MAWHTKWATGGDPFGGKLIVFVRLSLFVFRRFVISKARSLLAIFWRSDSDEFMLADNDCY